MATSPSKDEIDPRLEQLRNQTPAEFETTVAELWKAKGWNVSRPQTGEDESGTFIAKKGGAAVAIQAKQYGEAGEITEADMRQYDSLGRNHQNIQEVAVVTTGTFSDDARWFGSEHDIEMVDGEELSEQVAEFDLSPTEPSSDAETSESLLGEPVLEEDKTPLRGWFSYVTGALALFIVGGTFLLGVPDTSVFGTIAALGFLVGLLGLPVTIALDAMHLKRQKANYTPSLIWAPASLLTLGFAGIWYWLRRLSHTKIEEAY